MYFEKKKKKFKDLNISLQIKNLQFIISLGCVIHHAFIIFKFLLHNSVSMSLKTEAWYRNVKGVVLHSWLSLPDTDVGSGSVLPWGHFMPHRSVMFYSLHISYLYFCHQNFDKGYSDSFASLCGLSSFSHAGEEIVWHRCHLATPPAVQLSSWIHNLNISIFES